MTSKTTVLAVVFLVGVFALVGVAGIVLLAAFEVNVPGQLETLTATAIGGLIGILASTRSTLGANDVAPPQPPVNIMPTQQVRTLPQVAPPPAPTAAPLRPAVATQPGGTSVAAGLTPNEAGAAWTAAGGGAGMGVGNSGPQA